MTKPLFLSTIFTSLATFATAATPFLCEVKDTGGMSGGFIQTPLVFIFEDGFKAAEVLDATILYFMEAPAPAKVRARPDGTLRVSWRVKGIVTTSGSTISPRYSSVFDPEARTMTMRVSLPESENMERGKGACKVLSKSELRKLGLAR